MWYTICVRSGMSLSARPQVMRLRRAVLQIPPKPPVPPGLPLYKNRHSLTRSESTLPQVLIPRHFISFISNTYKKPGGGTPLPAPEFCNSLLPVRHFRAHTATPATPFPSMLYFTTLCIPSFSASSPLLAPRLSTVNCRPPLPARNSPARYAIVRWHRFSRTNHSRHSERSEESLFSARGKDRHAQAPKQGAEEKWQSAPYL
jgi:hypothetical protein